MTKISEFKEKVKAIIEKHGGKVGTDFIVGIDQQPKELQMVELPDRNWFDPVRIVFDGEHVTIGTTGSHYTLSQAKEYLKRLQAAISILEEIQQPAILEKAICCKCGAKIIREYANPDDPQEQIYICENGHHKHSVKFPEEIQR